MVLSVFVSVDERFALKVCRSVSDLGCLTSAFMILDNECVNVRRHSYQIGCRPFLPGNLFLLIGIELDMRRIVVPEESSPRPLRTTSSSVSSQRRLQ